VGSTKISIIRVFAKDNAADLLLQKVTQYAKRFLHDKFKAKMLNSCPNHIH